MPKTTRTFVALPIPEERSARLEMLQKELAEEAPGVKWVAPGNYHLTLAFLGDVIDTDLNEVCRAVGEAALGFEPLALRLEGLGAFPDPSRPRSIWVGLVGPGIAALRELQTAIATALRGVGYPPSDERFSPHVTLGRIKTDRERGRSRERGPQTRSLPPDLSALVARHEAWSAPAFEAVEVVTFASTLTPDGPQYAPLAHARLKGQAG